MTNIGVKERVAWLALAVLKGIERQEGIIKRGEAIRTLTERLGITDGQARNTLLFLVE